MTTSNPSFDPIRERSTGEKSSQQRWLFPFLLLGTNLLLATGLVLLRTVGWLQIRQSFMPLLVTGILLSGSAALVLFTLHRKRIISQFEERKPLFSLALVVPVLMGMLAVHPAEGLSLPGIYFFSVAYFMAFAGVLEWLNREAIQSRESELLPFEERGQPDEAREPAALELNETAGDNEALFAALLEQKPSVAEDHTDELKEADCSQWMNRSIDHAGCETVEGGIQIHFDKQQRLHIVHLSLNPPLEGTLSVTSEVEDGAGIRTRILENRAYGVSIEVKRTQNLEEEFQSQLHYLIASRPASEDVA
ncbi:hypothetical protein Enr10x_28110 [Gimesia panareensis]|uniref:Uncharacterized protein n=1 Tax=Gimesia panareensis TaxID=2527978 RepID=A0A517Q787_9PLAN|nr:hypothetical protein [Gimesia panareensis]QDT27494.1 hypothetical protein Enr10x_28110 [Gimesia panareensis]